MEPPKSPFADKTRPRLASPPGEPIRAWESKPSLPGSSMPGAASSLAAPDGTRCEVARKPPNVSHMWERIQEHTKTIHDKESEISRLKSEVEAKDEEVQMAVGQAQTAEQNRATAKAQLEQAQAEQKQLRVQIRSLEQQAQATALAAEEKSAAQAAVAAQKALEPVPPPAVEVQAALLSAFDTAAATIRNEIAANAGLAPGTESGDDFGCVGSAGFDSAAMLSANLPVEEIAEQYLRAVMQCAADVVEPARLQAVTGWQNELRKRRLLQDQLQELKGSIRVMCRVRPLAAGEGSSAVSVTSDSEVVLSQPGKDGRKTFSFDHCFGDASDQRAVFEEVEPVVESVLAGFNVCIFAYGQTGSGKTHTMQGGGDEAAGINPRALRRLFDSVREKREMAALGKGGKADDGWSYEVSVSYLEIYNENLRDLLVDPVTPRGQKGGEKKPASLDIRHVPGQPVHVPGLSTVNVETATEVERAIERGAARRSVTATKMNSASSRSHSIVIVSVTGRHAASGASTHGKLNLVDLAGSERVKKSEVSGQAMTEAQNINKSLSAIGDVMAALQEKSKHIPFRNSKLTHLLADSLGGSSKTFMFVNIGPSSDSAPESLCSLNFAMRVRKVELGKASSRRVEGASLQELKEAREREERALTSLRESKQLVGELEHEAAVLRESNQQASGELQKQSKAAAEYRDTEEFLKQQGNDRQESELCEERKRRQGAEAKLKEVQSRLQSSEQRCRALLTSTVEEATTAAARGELPDWGGAHGAGPEVTPQHMQQKLAALHQSATDRLQGCLSVGGGSTTTTPSATPVAAAAPSAAAAAAPTAASSSAAPLPPPPKLAAAPSGFGSSVSLLDLDLMDATVCLDASTAPLMVPLMVPQPPQPQPQQAAPLLQHVPPVAPQPLPPLAPDEPLAPQPPSAGKRKSPRLSAAAEESSTPHKQPRVAFQLPGSVDPPSSVRSSRKVTFAFPKTAAAADGAAAVEGAAAEAEDGISAFPKFALQPEPPPPSPGTAKENDFSNAWRPSSATKQRPTQSAFTFEAPPPPSLPLNSFSSLGGASRVVVGGGAKRARASSRPSLGPSGAIAKSASRASSNRRMSLVARQGEAGDVLMAKREAVMAAATRRSTMDHRV
jgi:hypothetical protein